MYFRLTNTLMYFRLIRPLSKVETRRDCSIALYVTVINCIDESLMLLNASGEDGLSY